MALSRRGFLRGASGAMGFVGAAAAMNKILGSEAFAATLSAYAGYRALVAVFLLGGNDTNNVLVPLTSNGTTGPYDRYAQARPSVKLSTAELLPVTPAGLAANSYGIHFKMPKVKALFAANKAAFVCNAGPLVLPIDKATYDSTPSARPENLFSHLDQQDAWASAIANPVTIALPPALVGQGPTGWGGRFADRIDGLNTGAYPEVISFGGKPLLCVGVERAPFSVGGSGALVLKNTSDVPFDTLRDGALEEVLTITNGTLMEAAYGSVAMTSIAYAEQRTSARDDAWAMLSTATRIAINTAFSPANAVPEPLDGPALKLMQDGSIVGQLYQVVRDIIAGATAAPDGLGQKRQVFSVGFGGFDTHSGQRALQDGLLEQLDNAIGAFQGAMDALAASTAFGATPPQATLFTMSDFGRTLADNSDGGTDHAWGSHVLVVGGSVLGGKLYGTFPNLDIKSGAVNNDTTDSRGRWIPTISVEQVANTLAFWMGATSATDRDYMFPNLMPYVNASPTGSIGKQQRLGFLTA